MMAVAAICLILTGGLCPGRRAVLLGLDDRHEKAGRFWDVHRRRYLDDRTPIFNGAFFRLLALTCPHDERPDKSHIQTWNGGFLSQTARTRVATRVAPPTHRR